MKNLSRLSNEGFALLQDLENVAQEYNLIQSLPVTKGNVVRVDAPVCMSVYVCVRN
jgi:hypothetical protein